MKILVTGASGFVGRHLLAELLKGGHEIVATAQATEVIPVRSHTNQVQSLPILPCDLTDSEAVSKLVNDCRPDAVVHLAAYSHLGSSWQKRDQMIDINVNGTWHLAKACNSTSRPVTFLFVSSGAVYNNKDLNKILAANEETLPLPSNPYAHSKLAAENIVHSYASDAFNAYVVRPFNHTGPGQSPDFVCPAFAKRIVEAPAGGTIKVGQLDSIKDFTDVRDIVRAYRLILEKRPEQKQFVLGSGKQTTVGEILNQLIDISGKKITTETDLSLLRPLEMGAVVANAHQAELHLAWKPEIPLHRTLSELYHEVQSKTFSN